jgi:hypothetical protein
MPDHFVPGIVGLSPRISEIRRMNWRHPPYGLPIHQPHRNSQRTAVLDHIIIFSRARRFCPPYDERDMIRI